MIDRQRNEPIKYSSATREAVAKFIDPKDGNAPYIIAEFEKRGVPEEIFLEICNATNGLILQQSSYLPVGEYYEKCMGEGISCTGSDLVNIARLMTTGSPNMTKSPQRPLYYEGEVFVNTVNIHKNQPELIAEVSKITKALYSEGNGIIWKNTYSRKMPEPSFEEKDRIIQYGIYSNLCTALEFKCIKDMDELKEIAGLCLIHFRVGIEPLDIIKSNPPKSARILKFLMELAIRQGSMNGASVSHITGWCDVRSLDDVSDADLQKALSISIFEKENRANAVTDFLISCGARSR